MTNPNDEPFRCDACGYERNDLSPTPYGWWCDECIEETFGIIDDSADLGEAQE